MNWKLVLNLILVFLLLSSCGAVRKAMHPERYCAEHDCHKEHAADSRYCTFHYTTKMYEIIGAAEKMKMEGKSAEMTGSKMEKTLGR